MERMRSLLGMVLAVGVLGSASEAGATKMILPEPFGGLIESATYAGEVRDRIARMEARYTIQIVRDGWTEVPITISGATITAVELERKSGEAHIVARPTGYVLAASRKGTYKVRVKFSALLVQDSQSEGLQLGIPRATFSTASLFVPRQDVELRPEDQLYIEREPNAIRGGVTLTAHLGAAEGLGVRWRTKPAAPERVEPVVYGEVHTLLTIEEQLVRLASIIDYRMAQGETKSFEVRIPAGVNILNVRGPWIEDWKVTESPEGKMLTVTLNTTLKETSYRLLIDGEQTMSAEAADYALPEIQLIGVKQERGHVAVARSGSIELTPNDATGINRVDVRELPDLLRVPGSPAILAFKYHQHPYRVALTLTRHEDHPVLAGIAERGELVTIISRQGELLTRATYLIKANKKQFLEVALPEGATLWSCIVGGKSVKPVEGGARKLMVPLETMSESADAVSVELVYFEHRGVFQGVGSLHLQGPILDVPTTIANWAVFAPRDVKLLKFSGNLERGAASFAFLQDSLIQVAAAQEMPFSGIHLGTTSGPVGREKDDGYRDDRLGGEAFKVAVAKRAMLRGYGEAGSRGSEDEPKEQNGKSWGFLTGQSKPKDSEEGVAKSMPEAPANSATATERQAVGDVVSELNGRLQESGILPLKIRLPESGTVYQFNRLMTAQDALRLDATFVHLKLSWMLVAGLGLMLVPVGGLAAVRLHRS